MAVEADLIVGTNCQMGGIDGDRVGVARGLHQGIVTRCKSEPGTGDAVAAYVAG